MRNGLTILFYFIVAGTASGLRPADAQMLAAEEPPMTFFVAKGAANSCGSDCNKWIAAEGRFDTNSSLRFNSFVIGLADRSLPVHFNSGGGVIGEARVIGRILRHHKMTATIGKTIPEGCRSGNNEDPACRKIMQSGTVVNARLSTSQARCYSSCFYALVGATTRLVPTDAKLGIHGSRHNAASLAAEKADGLTLEDLKASRKRYLVDMGVDPFIADLAEQFPPEKMHVLSREEIDRYKVESRGP